MYLGAYITNNSDIAVTNPEIRFRVKSGTDLQEVINRVIGGFKDLAMAEPILSGEETIYLKVYTDGTIAPGETSLLIDVHSIRVGSSNLVESSGVLEHALELFEIYSVNVEYTDSQGRGWMTSSKYDPEKGWYTDMLMPHGQNQ